MSEFKGTKGKWAVKHSESKLAFNVVGTLLGGKYKIARCSYILGEALNNRDIDEAKSNAKLIACAPELLEELIKLRIFVCNCKISDETNELVESSRLIIEKATT